MKDWHHFPSSFLVWATGWKKKPFTEIKNLKEEQVWIGGDSELSFRHVEIESL